jgi:hypothetical protein
VSARNRPSDVAAVAAAAGESIQHAHVASSAYTALCFERGTVAATTRGLPWDRTLSPSIRNALDFGLPTIGCKAGRHRTPTEFLVDLTCKRSSSEGDGGVVHVLSGAQSIGLTC